VAVVDSQGVVRLQEVSGANPAAALTLEVDDDVIRFYRGSDDSREYLTARTKLGYEEAGDAREGVLLRINDDKATDEHSKFFAIVDDGKLYLQSKELSGYLTETNGGLAVVNPGDNFEIFGKPKTVLGVTLRSDAIVEFMELRFDWRKDQEPKLDQFTDLERVSVYQKLMGIQDNSKVDTIKEDETVDVTGRLQTIGEKTTFVRELDAFLKEISAQDKGLSPEAAQGMGEIVTAGRAQFASLSKIITMLAAIAKSIESGLGLIPTDFKFNATVIRGLYAPFRDGTGNQAK
jgi:hypothetical protein